MAGSIVLNEVQVRNDQQQYQNYKIFEVQNCSNTIRTLIFSVPVKELRLQYIQKSTSISNLYLKYCLSSENTIDAQFKLTQIGSYDILRLNDSVVIKSQVPITRIDFICDTAETGASTILIKGVQSYV